MELIADILLIAGALGAAVYCTILSRRLRKFTDLERGVGGAVAVLSAQVDDMTVMLQKAQETALGSAESLRALTDRAEAVSRRLEVLVAAMHDLPDTSGEKENQNSIERPRDEEKVSLFKTHRAWTKELVG